MTSVWGINPGHLEEAGEHHSAVKKYFSVFFCQISYLHLSQPLKRIFLDILGVLSQGFQFLQY